MPKYEQKNQKLYPIY